MSARLTPEAVLALDPVLPVITIEDVAWAAPLAQALTAGGLRSAEITLRTPVALDAIAAMTKAAPDLILGAGTVLSEADCLAAAAAGAHFALSPGAPPALLKALAQGPIAFIPGIATATELMTGLELGYSCFKFFPAERLGGVAALRDLAGPLPKARFCPTGGISPERVADYRALANVLCVGGSWVTPIELMRRSDWGAIELLARKAASLR